MSRWFVARVEFLKLDNAQQLEVVEWLYRLGIDPEQFRPVFVVTSDNDGELAAHFSELLRNAAGRRFMDYVLDQAATRPVTVPVDRASLPSCVPVPVG